MIALNRFTFITIVLLTTANFTAAKYTVPSDNITVNQVVKKYPLFKTFTKGFDGNEIAVTWIDTQTKRITYAVASQMITKFNRVLDFLEKIDGRTQILSTAIKGHYNLDEFLDYFIIIENICNPRLMNVDEAINQLKTLLDFFGNYKNYLSDKQLSESDLFDYMSIFFLGSDFTFDSLNQLTYSQLLLFVDEKQLEDLVDQNISPDKGQAVSSHEHDQVASITSTATIVLAVLFALVVIAILVSLICYKRE